MMADCRNHSADRDRRVCIPYFPEVYFLSTKLQFALRSVFAHSIEYYNACNLNITIRHSYHSGDGMNKINKGNMQIIR